MVPSVVPTWAIGDIHGHSAALSDLLAKLTTEIAPGDDVVFLGDYIDRGPDTRGCLELIMEFKKAWPVHVTTLLGNHEHWMRRTMDDPHRHSWLMTMEAFATMESYSMDAARALRSAAEEAAAALYGEKLPLPYELFFEHVPQSHLDFIHGLVPFHRTADGVFVHGGLDPHSGPVDHQPLHYLLFGTPDFVAHYSGPEVLVYGHHDNAVVDDNDWPHPNVTDWTIGIDTISHGVLTAIRLPDRRVVQSDRHRRAS